MSLLVLAHVDLDLFPVEGIFDRLVVNLPEVVHHIFFTVYYFWDEDTNQVVVGWLSSHLSNRIP